MDTFIEKSNIRRIETRADAGLLFVLFQLLSKNPT